jgi:hypothetical protein
MRGQGQLAGSRFAAHGIALDASELKASTAAGNGGRGAASARSGATAAAGCPRPQVGRATPIRLGTSLPPCPIPSAWHTPPSKAMPCAAGWSPANRPCPRIVVLLRRAAINRWSSPRMIVLLRRARC